MPSPGAAALPDLRAHNGLRGFMALWVALFHATLYSSAAGKGRSITLQASAVMPAFFALSGFTIALVYSRTQWATPRCCGCCIGRGRTRRAQPPPPDDPESAQPRLPPFDWRRFLRNRVARLGPTYWLSLALGLPPTLVGFSVAGGAGASPRNGGDIAGAAAMAAFGLSTVAGALPWGACLNASGWFVCTLTFFYLAVPIALPAAQRLSDAQLARGVAAAYWLQWLLWGLVIAIGVGAMGGWFTNWRFLYTLATFTPWSRFPIFFSGVFAGLLCLRAPPAEPLPAWPRAVARLLPLPWLEASDNDTVPPQLLWARRTLLQSALQCALFVAIIVMENCLVLVDGTTAYPHFWLQCVLPFAQTELIVGLARGGGCGGTWVGSALASRPLTWLGDISMELFLLHWPVMMYVNWARSERPSLAWPAARLSATCTLTGSGCERYAAEPWYDAWTEARTLPGWAIPVVVAVSVALSAAVHYGFAQPLRKLLRAPSAPKKEKDPPATPGGAGSGDGAAEGGGRAAADMMQTPALPPPPPLTPQCAALQQRDAASTAADAAQAHS